MTGPTCNSPTPKTRTRAHGDVREEAVALEVRGGLEPHLRNSYGTPG